MISREMRAVRVHERLADVQIGDVRCRHRAGRSGWFTSSSLARVASGFCPLGKTPRSRIFGLGQALAQLLDDRRDALRRSPRRCSIPSCSCRSSGPRREGECRRSHRARSSRARAGSGRRRCRNWPRAAARRTASRPSLLFHPWVIESPRKSRSMFPFLAWSRNDSCSFIHHPSARPE